MSAETDNRAIPSTLITDSTPIGRSMLTASDALSERSIIALELEEPIQSLAKTYFDSHVTNLSLSQKRRINRCVQILVDAGIDDDLVDACFLREGQNTETSSPKTLKGVVGTLDGTPAWTADGIILNGSTTRGSWDTTAVSSHTIIADMTGSPSGQVSDGFLFGVINTLGLTIAASSLSLSGTGAALPYTREGGSAVQGNVPVGDNGQAFTVHYYNPLPQIVAYSNDNAASPTLKAYVDGYLSMTDSAGNQQVSSTLNKLIVGARFLSAGFGWDIPYKGSAGGWMLFNKVLNQMEIDAATKAMRALNPRSVNVVTYGDSLTAQLSDATRVVGNWPVKLMQSPLWAGRARLFNPANNGTTADYGASNYAARVSAYAPDGITVQQSVLYILYGTNDILAGTSAADIWTDLKSIYAQARADGFIVIAITVPPSQASGGYSGAQETVRLTLNSSILSSVGIESHAALDLSAFISGQVESSLLFVNAFHPTPDGYQGIASWIAEGWVGLPPSGAVFDKTITAAGTTGARTINKPSGTVNFAIGATTLVVTNSLCTVNSIVFASVRSNDATASIKNIIPAAGSFTITLGAAATAETSVGFLVMN